MSVAKISESAALAKFNDLLLASGTRDALAYLVTLTDYRFIAIFRFQDGMANAAVYYDRENPGVLNTQEVPETSTYCCYVRDSNGVPVLDGEGAILGTLCHYDVVPRDPEQIDLSLMLSVAAALSKGNNVPPFPTR
jgi:hypothetical protein